jgi:fucose permease
MTMSVGGITTVAVAPAQLRRARVGVMLAFLANGATFGTWASRIPEVRDRLGLSDAVLGLALLSIATGAVVAMPLTGALIGRFSSRRMTLVGTILMAIGLTTAGFAPMLLLLVAGLACLGVGSGWQDVSMNTHGVEVERRVGRPVLSGFHAMFSVGGMIGSALGGVAVALGVPVQMHFALIGIGILAVGGTAWALLLPGRVDPPSSGPTFQRPPMAVVGLGLLGFGAMMAEGSVADWSAVLMNGSLGASTVTAAFAFSAFALLMTIGRFLGDPLVARFGSVTVTRGGGWLSAVGFLVAIGVGSAVGGLVGFAMVGAGLAPIVPIIFRAAGHVPGVSTGAGIAAATTLAYLGFVVGPPAIGFAGERLSLPIALGGMAVVMALVALNARRTELSDQTVA